MVSQGAGDSGGEEKDSADEARGVSESETDEDSTGDEDAAVRSDCSLNLLSPYATINFARRVWGL